MPKTIMEWICVVAAIYGTTGTIFFVWYIIRVRRTEREQAEKDKNGPVLITFEFGRTLMARDAFDALQHGSVITLDSANGSGYRVYGNNSVLAEGNLVSQTNGFRAVQICRSISRIPSATK